jgi:hypothetical protein
LWSVECFYGFSGLHINNNSLYNDNMTLTCGVLNVSISRNYCWYGDRWNHWNIQHSTSKCHIIIVQGIIVDMETTETIETFNTPQVSVIWNHWNIQHSTSVYTFDQLRYKNKILQKWQYDTYLWCVECFNGFSGLHINNNSLIWHLLVECWMFQWFQILRLMGICASCTHCAAVY